MKLLLKLGLTGPRKEVSWYQPIEHFPPLVTYQGRKWEFVVYDEDDSGMYDYECMFSEIPSHSPTWYVTTYESLEYILGETKIADCECGNAKNPIGQGHSVWCKRYRKEFS